MARKALLEAPRKIPSMLTPDGQIAPEVQRRVALANQPLVASVWDGVIAQIQAKEATSEYDRFKAKYKNNRAAFVRECFDWPDDDGPTEYQVEILNEFDRSDKIAARGPRGLGKTTIMAWLVLHWALVHDCDKHRDWKVVTTAGAWRQLEKFLWPEVHKWAKRLRWHLIGRDPFNDRTELLGMKLQLKTGEAFAVASDNTDLIEGAHADDIMYLYDESKSIAAATFDACSGAMSGVGAKTKNRAKEGAFSTPGETQGRFYDIHRRAPGFEDWKVFHVTKERAIAAGRISIEWVQQKLKQWGKDSQLYQNQAEGNFAAADENGIIPIAWVEAAFDRHDAIMEAGGDFGPLTSLGGDIADGGKDDTTLAYNHGVKVSRVRKLEKLKKSENDGVSRTMEIVGEVVKALDSHDTSEPVGVIDGNGAGAGTASRLKEIQRTEKKLWSIVSFVAQEKADPNMKDRYGEEKPRTKRAAAWLNARYILDPDNGLEPALPRDDRLLADFTLPRRKPVNSDGSVDIESKDEIAKRNDGRSTDFADAVVMAWFVNIPGKKRRGLICRAT